MKIQFISCVFLFVSCTSGVKLKAVNLGPLFHDSNSKVWMVDKVIADKQNFATLSLYFTNERWDFKIDALSEDTIVLKPLNTSDLKYSMILVPFPEF